MYFPYHVKCCVPRNSLEPLHLRFDPVSARAARWAWITADATVPVDSNTGLSPRRLNEGERCKGEIRGRKMNTKAGKGEATNE